MAQEGTEQPKSEKKPPLKTKVKSSPLVKRRKDERKSPLPQPSSYRAKLPEQFWEYWRTNYEKYSDLIVVYGYRVWPVVDNTLPELPGKPPNEKAPSYFAKWSEPMTIEEFIREYGDGHYTLKLTDAPNRTGCVHELKHWIVRGSGVDPVLNIHQLDMFAPENKTYIQRLQSRGLLPLTEEQIKKQKEEEEEMAEKESIVAMTNLVGELARETRKPPPEKPSAPSAPPADIQQVTAGSQQGMLLMGEGFSRAIEALGAVAKINSNPPPQTDPVDTFAKVAALVREMSPKVTGPSDPVATILPVIQSSNANMIAAMREMQQANAAAQAASDARISTLLEKMAEKEAAKNPLEILTQAKEIKAAIDEDEPKSSKGGSDWKETIIASLPSLFQTALNVFVAYNPPKQSEHNGATNHQQHQAIPPMPSPEEQFMAKVVEQLPVHIRPFIPQLRENLALVAVPLIRDLTTMSRTGADFASVFVAVINEEAYDTLRAQGPDTIAAILHLHPQVMQACQSVGAERLSQFVKDFIEWGDADDEEAAPAVPAVVPRVKAIRKKPEEGPIAS